MARAPVIGRSRSSLTLWFHDPLDAPGSIYASRSTGKLPRRCASFPKACAETTLKESAPVVSAQRLQWIHILLLKCQPASFDICCLFAFSVGLQITATASPLPILEECVRRRLDRPGCELHPAPGQFRGLCLYSPNLLTKAFWPLLSWYLGFPG